MTGWDRKEKLKDKAMEACCLINPDNPIAAAEAMPEIFRLLLAAVVDAQKICGKLKLDPKEWLDRAHAAIDKATSEEVTWKTDTSKSHR